MVVWRQARSRRLATVGAAVVLGAGVAAAACGGDEDTTVDTGVAPSESTTTDVAPTDPPPVDTGPVAPAAEPVRVASADGAAVLTIPAGALPVDVDPADVSIESSVGEMYHEEIETFRSDFVEALRNGDVDSLVDRLHPDVMSLYGEGSCRDYLSTVVDADADMIVAEVGEPGPWRWEVDGATQEYSAAVPLEATFTSRGQTVEQEVHVVSIGGQLHWWTDCGDPLPDGLADGELLRSETVGMVRLEPSGLALSEPATLEWRLPRSDGLFLGVHVSGGAVEMLDLDLVLDRGDEATAVATVDHFSDLQIFDIPSEELVVTASNPEAVSRNVGESFDVQNSIRRRPLGNRTATLTFFFGTTYLGDVLIGRESETDPNAPVEYIITPYQEDWTVSKRHWSATSPVEPYGYAQAEPETHSFDEADDARSGPFTCKSAGKADVVYWATYTARVDAVPSPDLPADLELPSLQAAEGKGIARHRTEVDCIGPAPTTTTSDDTATTAGPTTTSAPTTTADGTDTTTAGPTTTAPATVTTTVEVGAATGTGVDHPPFEPGNEGTEGASVGIACGEIPAIGAGATVTIEVEGGGSSGLHTGITDADGAFRIPFPIQFYDVLRWRIVDISVADGASVDIPDAESELAVDADDVACTVDG